MLLPQTTDFSKLLALQYNTIKATSSPWQKPKLQSFKTSQTKKPCYLTECEGLTKYDLPKPNPSVQLLPT